MAMLLKTTLKFVNESHGRASIKVKEEELNTVDSLKFMPCNAYMQDWVLSVTEIAESPFDVNSMSWDQGVSAASNISCMGRTTVPTTTPPKQMLSTRCLGVVQSSNATRAVS